LLIALKSHSFIFPLCPTSGQAVKKPQETETLQGPPCAQEPLPQPHSQAQWKTPSQSPFPCSVKQFWANMGSLPCLPQRALLYNKPNLGCGGGPSCPCKAATQLVLEAGCLEDHSRWLRNLLQFVTWLCAVFAEFYQASVIDWTDLRWKFQ